MSEPNFKAFDSNGLSEQETVLQGAQNWKVAGESEGSVSIYGLGEIPEVGDVIHQPSSGRVFMYRVTETEGLRSPSNYDWRAEGKLLGYFTPAALAKTKRE